MTIWGGKAGDLTNSEIEKVDFCLPQFSATKIMMWVFYVDEST